MIDTIYLVKKNPNKPNSEDNWLMMSIAEYNEFVKTPAAKGRYFADVGGHEDSVNWYVAECDKKRSGSLSEKRKKRVFRDSRFQPRNVTPFKS